VVVGNQTKESKTWETVANEKQLLSSKERRSKREGGRVREQMRMGWRVLEFDLAGKTYLSQTQEPAFYAALSGTVKDCGQTLNPEKKKKRKKPLWEESRIAKLGVNTYAPAAKGHRRSGTLKQSSSTDRGQHPDQKS